MKLSKEQRQELEAKLSHPWGRVSLECDGFKVDLVVEKGKGMTFRVVTYVNGCWKGEWISGNNSHPEQKFLRKSVRSLATKKQKDAMEKAVGKRYFKKMCAEESFWTKTITLYDVSWSSGRQAIAHLCKVSDVIRVLPAEII